MLPYARAEFCMSDPDHVVASALRWLTYSTEDLDVARVLLGSCPLVPRHICWLAQQSAEKALKAALVLEEIAFPFTHDLDALRNRLPEIWLVHTAHSDLAELTQWAIETRYPGDWPEVTSEDAVRAEREAASLRDSMVAEFERRGLLSDTGQPG